MGDTEVTESDVARNALLAWLRKVALFSNDGWLAREAHDEYLRLTGKEPEL
jgi:hypothetical protein